MMSCDNIHISKSSQRIHEQLLILNCSTMFWHQDDPPCYYLPVTSPMHSTPTLQNPQVTSTLPFIADPLYVDPV